MYLYDQRILTRLIYPGDYTFPKSCALTGEGQKYFREGHKDGWLFFAENSKTYIDADGKLHGTILGKGSCTPVSDKNAYCDGYLMGFEDAAKSHAAKTRDIISNELIKFGIDDEKYKSESKDIVDETRFYHLSSAVAFDYRINDERGGELAFGHLKKQEWMSVLYIRRRIKEGYYARVESPDSEELRTTLRFNKQWYHLKADTETFIEMEVLKLDQEKREAEVLVSGCYIAEETAHLMNIRPSLISITAEGFNLFTALEMPPLPH